MANPNPLKHTWGGNGSQVINAPPFLATNDGTKTNSLWLFMDTLLKNLGWTVDQSCNGGEFGSGDKLAGNYYAFHRRLVGTVGATAFTVTIASPGVVTHASNGFLGGEVVYLTTTGALPTGLSVNTPYYIVSPAAGSYSFATTLNGTPINTSGTQSGTHSVNRAPTWIVYKSPVGIVAGTANDYLGYTYLTISGSAVTSGQSTATTLSEITTGTFLSFYYHNTVPTGGSLTAVPTSSEQVSFINQQVILSSVTLKFHCNGVSTGAASKGKGACWGMVTDTSGSKATTLISILPAINTQLVTGNKDYPFATGINIVFSSNLSTASVTSFFNSTKGWHISGSANTANWKGLAYRRNDGTCVETGVTSSGDANGQFQVSAILMENNLSSSQRIAFELADILETGATPAAFTSDFPAYPLRVYLPLLSGGLFIPCTTSPSF